MSKSQSSEFPLETLTGSVKDYRELQGSDMIGRVNGFFDWQDGRRRHGLWPYSKASKSAPRTSCEALTDNGQTIVGVNFASQDYLSLSSHDEIKNAAKEAIEQYGVHSAGSGALLGNTGHSLQLEQVISEFSGMDHAVLFPTGWSAGFSVVQGLVRPSDHVLLDVLSHSCLQEGARAATSNIHFHGHLNVEGAARRLKKIRASDPKNAIMVVTESLFSMHADTPDLRALQQVCREHDATLVVDVAHDFGCIGEHGRGHLELQNMMSEVDLVVGSFSKTFASNGGFVLTRSQAVKEYLKYYSATHTFSNALSPVQAAVVLKAFEIIRSEEGRALRTSLMDNVVHLRDSLERARLDVTGDPCAIVPVNIGAEGHARIASKLMADQGAVVNLVEYPAVPRGNARFRLQVMAEHSREDVDQLVKLMRHAISEAETIYHPYRGLIMNGQRTQESSAAA